MCLSLRNTLSRGRSAVPTNMERVLHLRRSRRICLSLFLSAIFVHLRFAIANLRLNCKSKISLLRTCSSKRLAGLDLDDFAFVTNAFALVRLGLAHAAKLAGELS